MATIERAPQRPTTKQRIDNATIAIARAVPGFRRAHEHKQAVRQAFEAQQTPQVDHRQELQTALRRQLENKFDRKQLDAITATVHKPYETELTQPSAGRDVDIQIARMENLAEAGRLATKRLNITTDAGDRVIEITKYNNGDRVVGLKKIEKLVGSDEVIAEEAMVLGSDEQGKRVVMNRSINGSHNDEMYDPQERNRTNYSISVGKDETRSFRGDDERGLSETEQVAISTVDLKPDIIPDEGVTTVNFMGYPGVGKGTAAKGIDDDDTTHFSTGDMFRGSTDADVPPYGRFKGPFDEERQNSDNGGMVRDVIMMPAAAQVIVERIFDGYKRLLLDGVIRMESNEKYIREVVEAELQHNGIDVRRINVFFDAPEKTVVKRLAKRGKKSGRKDDAAAQARLEEYKATTLPVVKMLERWGQLRRVDAGKRNSVEQVRRDTQNILDQDANGIHPNGNGHENAPTLNTMQKITRVVREVVFSRNAA